MKTFLAQNQFMSPASHVPVDVVPAAANSCPQPPAAADLRYFGSYPWPDFDLLMEAIEGGIDPVWADKPPLFLKG